MDLYHNNMSVCAQKVRLVLREKELTPNEHHMNLRDGDVHRPEYLRLNPKGVVPTLIDKGHVITESTVICEYLEEAYPEHSLRPVDPFLRAKMRQWTQLPDAILHQATGIVSVAVAWRQQMLAAGGAQLRSRPNFAGSTTLLRDLVEHGLESTHVAPAVKILDYAVAQIASALRSGPWLVGGAYTLADSALLPYICRLEDLTWSWFWEGEREAVGEWLERAKGRANYAGISEYIDPGYISLLKGKGSEATPAIRAALKT